MILFGKDNEIVDPTPARPAAAALAAALSGLLESQAALEKAKGEVPSYTGSMSSHDYYGFEQEQVNRAADRLLDLVSPGAGLKFVADHDVQPVEAGDYWCTSVKNGEIFLANLEIHEVAEPEWRFVGTTLRASPQKFEAMHFRAIAKVQPPTLVEAAAEELTGPRI